MAWTAPRTWVTSETVTSTIMNTHVRDNLNWLHDNFVTRGQQAVTIVNTSSNGNATVTHNLGSTPVAVLVSFITTPYATTSSGAATPVLCQADSFGATTFRIQLVVDTGLALNGGNQVYTMSWIAVAT